MTSPGKLDSSLDIMQIIYCSHAANSEDKSQFERDLRDILDHSQAYNPSHDITGALTTDGDMFAHVIEGPSVAVANLYAKIMRDKRHDRALTLQHTLVHVRLFNLWPMAFLRVGTIRHTRTLDARSAPAELRRAAIFILKTFRPILLK